MVSLTRSCQSKAWCASAGRVRWADLFCDPQLSRVPRKSHVSKRQALALQASLSSCTMRMSMSAACADRKPTPAQGSGDAPRRLTLLVLPPSCSHRSLASPTEAPSSPCLCRHWSSTRWVCVLSCCVQASANQQARQYPTLPCHERVMSASG